MSQFANDTEENTLGTEPGDDRHWRDLQSPSLRPHSFWSATRKRNFKIWGRTILIVHLLLKLLIKMFSSFLAQSFREAIFSSRLFFANPLDRSLTFRNVFLPLVRCVRYFSSLFCPFRNVFCKLLTPNPTPTVIIRHFLRNTTMIIRFLFSWLSQRRYFKFYPMFLEKSKTIMKEILFKSVSIF